MKKTCILSILIFLATTLSAQTIIKNPKCGIKTITTVEIEKIILDEDTCTIYFMSSGDPGSELRLPENISIVSHYDWKIDSVIETRGIRLGQSMTIPESGKVSWQAIYPALADSTALIDIGTFYGTGSWLIYDIQIQERIYDYEIPSQVKGNWMNSLTEDWEFGIFDTMVIYDGNVWSVSAINKGKRSGSISISRGILSKTIRFEYTMKGKTSFAVGNDSFQEFKKVNKNQYATLEGPNESFSPLSPSFDSVKLEGFILNWNQRMGISGLNIFISNIFNSEQNFNLADISKNGEFSITLPCYLPGKIYLSTQVFRREVFIEPGQSLFVLIDPNERDNTLFMGESARINRELMVINDSIEVGPFSGETILNVTPNEYKSNLLQYLQSSSNTLESLITEKNISQKAFEIANKDISLKAYVHMTNYYSSYLNAYVRKNQLTGPLKSGDLPHVELPDDYYNFLNDYVLNDPLNLVSENYRGLLFAISYNTRIAENMHFDNSYSLGDFKTDMEAEGFTFSDEELNYINEYEEAYTKEYQDLQKYFAINYSQKSRDLNDRYAEEFEKAAIQYEVEILTSEQKKQYLTDLGLLTKEDQAILDQMEDYMNHPARLKLIEISKKYSDVHQKIMVDLREEKSELAQNHYKESIIRDIQKRWDIKDGIFTDLIRMRQTFQDIEHNFSPLSEKQLAKVKSTIGSDFIFQYIQQTNQELIDLHERNGSLITSIKNETPANDSDSLFASIIKKYKGKVIYVDFWASWCSPCRSGIKTIAPLKAELANEDIVFLYITGPSTPQPTWENLIPGISGEHYRVNDKEWNELASQFRIRGIPHYMLINKEGDITQLKMPHLSMQQLKQILLKELKN